MPWAALSADLVPDLLSPDLSAPQALPVPSSHWVLSLVAQFPSGGSFPHCQCLFFISRQSMFLVKMMGKMWKIPQTLADSCGAHPRHPSVGSWGRWH